MRLIQEAADQELVWRKPSACKEHDELCAGDELLATLDWGPTWGALGGARGGEAWSAMAGWEARDGPLQTLQAGPGPLPWRPARRS